MAGLPVGQIILLLLALAVFLGWTHRALDRMRLTDTMALVLLAIMFAGAFLPPIPLGPVRLGIGGFFVPVGVAVYLLVTADEAHEKRRGIVAAVLAGAIVYALDKLLPPDPGLAGPIDLDPLWTPAIVAGVVGYLSGRSRRASFIAGVLGLVLADVFTGIANAVRNIPGAFASIGTGGVFDGVVLAGVLAVLLAEVVGESREFFARQKAGREAGDGGGADGPGGGAAEPGRSVGPDPGADRRRSEGDDRPSRPVGAAIPAAGDPSPAVDPNLGAPGGTLRGPSSRPAGGHGDESADASSPARAALSVIVAAALIAAGTVGGDRLWGSGWAHRLAGVDGSTHFRLVDEAGTLITAMGRPIFVGDEYIDRWDNWFRVDRLAGNTAFARSLGTSTVDGDEHDYMTAALSMPAGRLPEVPIADELPTAEGEPSATTRPGSPPGVTPDSSEPTPDGEPGSRPRPPAGTSRLRRTEERSDDPALQDGPPREGRTGGLLDFFRRRRVDERRRVLLIHTHNGESFVSSDGTDMKEGKGGIHEVGAALAEALEKEGLAATHDESIHLPHDRSAYRRSRNTIVQRFRESPAMVIDVHRDATPAEYYAHEIDGKGVTQVRMVVGRQNPNRSQNLKLARELKSIADEMYPGLVKGIYSGRGNYNQDLGPRVILFEMGAHTNARESAERSARYMAKVIKAWFDKHFED